ncbi:LegC family aminotransferase [Pseudomonas sp. zfem001]|uniref:LegC family aminotransferase n=1 Tax=Pseudomonas sp. zfem001 TaxID=3078196 RepID=UPI002927A8AA|nr:LegC family aminotransferase [Pseudomonas sp. zfem001]MDU9410467.1 LegC family aminotransferase [Pseudomonas sp. zfem001]
MFDALVRFVREQYRTEDFIPLHAPAFKGQESGYVQEAIESTFVSSVGAFVDRFEKDAAAYTGAARAVATVNGTAALHAALLLAGVQRDELVITQALTFVATCNAIAYCGAQPVFVDVDQYTLGMSPTALDGWLQAHARLDADGNCRSKDSDRRIAACLPMHTFGHPADLDGLVRVCEQWNLPLVEDAAESLGSLYRGKHTGSFGLLGTLSFNGNKIITTGGGGMILTNEALGARAKHLTTTAKRPHPFEYVHDEVGFNYRLPNLNAALGCAQLEQLEHFIASKRELASRYAAHLEGSELIFVQEPEHCRSNYWLNAVICPSRERRDLLLQASNAANVMTRPIWQLMCDLPAYAHCSHDGLQQSRWLADRIVNLPSSVLPEHLS